MLDGFLKSLGYSKNQTTTKENSSHVQVINTHKCKYDSTYGFDYENLREKSNFAYWDSPQAQALLNRLTDSVISRGLTLESTPIWPLLGMDKEDSAAKHKITKEIELRFGLWANSKNCDASGKFNFYQLQAIEFLNRLRDGETFIKFNYDDNKIGKNPLQLQFISPNQIKDVYNPSFVEQAKAKGHRIINGIEVDEALKEHQIFVQTANFTQIAVPFDGKIRKFLIHPVNSDILGSVRGTPYLANCLNEFKKIADYTIAEMEAAIINALIAVWIKPSSTADAGQVFNGITNKNNTVNTTDDSDIKHRKMDKSGLVIQNLKAGEDIQSFDTKRPNVNFKAFIDAIIENLSASKGVPYEILKMSFNANYSASRASLLLFWNKIEVMRQETASQFLSEVYEAWFKEEVRLGNIQAKGFNRKTNHTIKQAWLSHSWVGTKLPSIDPKKEADAVNIRLSAGLTTRDKESKAYNGSDYIENVTRLVEENTKLAEANEPLTQLTLPMGNTEEPEEEEEEKKENGTDN